MCNQFDEIDDIIINMCIIAEDKEQRFRLNNKRRYSNLTVWIYSMATLSTAVLQLGTSTFTV